MGVEAGPLFLLCSALVLGSGKKNQKAQRHCDDWPKKPADGPALVDPQNLLRKLPKKWVLNNMTKINRARALHPYLVVLQNLPPNEKTEWNHAKNLLMHWFRADPRGLEKSILILIAVQEEKVLYAAGARARRRIKDAETRRLVKRITNVLKHQGVNVAAPKAMDYLNTSMRKSRGVLNSFRAILFPIILGGMLWYWFIKNRQMKARFENGDPQLMGWGGYANPFNAERSRLGATSVEGLIEELRAGGYPPSHECARDPISHEYASEDSEFEFIDQGSIPDASGSVSENPAYDVDALSRISEVRKRGIPRPKDSSQM